MKKLKEPARTKLFWLPIYRVVIGIIADVIVDLWESCNEFMSGKHKLLWIVVFPFLIVVYPLLAISCALFFIGAMLVTLGNYIAGGVVYVIDTVYLRIKSISVVCPVCQNKFVVPTFVCPTCGAEHKSLRPGRYGLFHRTCSCGTRLPSSCLTGRHKLDYKCPHCGKTNSGNSFTHDISIPVIGGASSGKTCYINMAIREIEKLAPSYGLDFALETANSANNYSHDIDMMNKGMLPDKTGELRLSYYQFYLTEHGGKVKNLVSLCDVAGELFTSSKDVSDQVGFKNARQFLIMLDPLSVRDFRDEVETSRDVSKASGSVKSMDDVLSTLIDTLEAYSNRRGKHIFDCDVAVVINKCDIPEVAREVGETAVADALGDKSLGLKTELDATNYVCEQFLKKYNETNFLQQLKAKFTSVQFFVSSALGHDVDNTAFEPVKVEDAVLWLIDRESSRIDLKDKWHKTV